MAFCRECGTEITGAGTFCGECGTKVAASVGKVAGPAQRRPATNRRSTIRRSLILAGVVVLLGVVGYLYAFRTGAIQRRGTSGETGWSAQGLWQGIMFAASTTANKMPELRELISWWAQTVDSVLHKEQIIFRRNNRLWTMGPDGRGQREAGTDMLNNTGFRQGGHWIVYTEGTDARPVRSSAKSCILLSTAPQIGAERIEVPHCANPVLSGDGNTLAFVRVEETYSQTEAQERIAARQDNPDAMKEGAPKTTALFFYNLRERNERKMVGVFPRELITKTYQGDEWFDLNLRWSPDGRTLHFSRDFMPYAEKGGPRSAYLLYVTTSTIDYLGEEGRSMWDWAGENLVYSEEGETYAFDLKTKSRLKWNLGIPYLFLYFLDAQEETVLLSLLDQRNETATLLTYDLRRGRRVLIGQVNGWGTRGIFRPDGKGILYTENATIWQVDNDGTNRRIIAFIEQSDVIEKILTHLGLWPTRVRSPPVASLAA